MVNVGNVGMRRTLKGRRSYRSGSKPTAVPFYQMGLKSIKKVMAPSYSAA